MINDNNDKSEQLPQLIDYIENTHVVTKKLVDNISHYKTKLDPNFLGTLNHELRTPLVPIRAYAEMLSQGKFGELSEEQKKRLDIIVTNVNMLQQKIETLLDKKIMNTETDKKSFRLKETEQVKLVLERLNDLLTGETKQDERKIEELQNMLTKSIQSQKERKQEEIILGRMVKNEEQRNLLSKKHIMTIAGAAIAITIITAGYSLLVVDLMGYQYRVADLGEIRSGYVIQNLRGDTIDTWLSWRLVDGSTINVNLIDGEKYPAMADIVREVILSEESIEIDDSLLHKGPKGTTSTYYVGWTGALGEAAKNPTEFYIPHKFNLIESQKGEGEITINLTNMRSGDGYSGYTQSIADDSQNQILKSNITIYEVDKLSKAQFETILRHELGHAFGLAHSTAPEDLMHPTIETDYPYISPCDIDAITLLYDGGKKSDVVCEK